MPDKPNEAPEPQLFDPKHLELAVIGFALAFAERFYDIEDLNDFHFVDPSRRKVFKTFKALVQQHGPAVLQPPSLALAKLAEMGMPEDQGFAILTEARDYAPVSPGAIGGIKEQMITMGMRRNMAEVSQQLQQLSTSTLSADEIADQASTTLNNALRYASTVEVVSMAEAVEMELKRLESGSAGAMGYSTGLEGLDNMLTGFHPGEMIVVGGRPGMGKSSLLNKFAVAMGLFQNMPGVIFSLEIKAAEYLQRILCNLAHVNMHKARLRAMNSDERARYISWAHNLAQTGIFVNDMGGISVPKIQATCRRLYYEEGIKWAAIDYVQLVDHLQRRNESTENALARTSNALKALALSLNMPVIVLSQLNRDCEKRDNKRPRMSDLRASGALEQDADVIMFVYRDSEYWSPDEKERNKDTVVDMAELIIAKQRNGPVGTVKVSWRRDCAEFCNPEGPIGGIWQ